MSCGISSKKGHDVEVYHIVVSAAFCSPNRMNRLVRGISRSKAKAVVVEVLLEDRLYDLAYRLLAYAISNGGNTERSLLPVVLLNVMSQNRVGS